VSDTRKSWEWLRDTATAFHEAVRFNLHDVRLVGVDPYYEVDPGPQKRILKSKPIDRIWSTMGIQNDNIDSRIFDIAATNYANGIRGFGRRVKTALNPELYWPNRDGEVCHLRGCGLHLTAQRFGDTIAFSTLVQRV